MAVADDIKAIFDAMPAQINADAAKGMNSTIQFKLTGDGGGDYYVEIKKTELQRYETYARDNGIDRASEATTQWEQDEYFDFF